MLKIENLNKKFRQFSIFNVSLETAEGDYFVILGESGAGKSVILEMVAGLIKPDSGMIFLNNKNITRAKIQNRGVGIVFQDYAVFTHLTVYENIAYSLKAKKRPKQEIRDEVIKCAQATNIAHLLHRYPEKLSGGEKQRMVLARALANKPCCLLLDEPLSSLDIGLKEEIRSLLRSINEQGITIVHVTHDYEEAIALANKVAIMHKGEIIQNGPINEVFQNPNNEFVARFTGIKNFFDAKIIHENIAEINAKVSIRLSDKCVKERAKVIIESKHITISVSKFESSAINLFQGVICELIPQTAGCELKIDIGVVLTVLITRESKEKYGFTKNMNVWVSFKASSVRVI